MEVTETAMGMAAVMVVVGIDMDMARARAQTHFIHPQNLENQGSKTLRRRC